MFYENYNFTNKIKNSFCNYTVLKRGKKSFNELCITGMICEGIFLQKKEGNQNYTLPLCNVPSSFATSWSNHRYSESCTVSFEFTTCARSWKWRNCFSTIPALILVNNQKSGESRLSDYGGWGKVWSQGTYEGCSHFHWTYGTQKWNNFYGWWFMKYLIVINKRIEFLSYLR